jgi:hypothetical protein
MFVARRRQASTNRPRSNGRDRRARAAHAPFRATFVPEFVETQPGVYAFHLPTSGCPSSKGQQDCWRRGMPRTAEAESWRSYSRGGGTVLSKVRGSSSGLG